MTLPQLIILDRDGVINQDSDQFIKSEAEFHLIPGSSKAIAKLKQAGLLVTVATNQSGVARGLFNIQDLNKMHEKLAALLKKDGGSLDYIAICPHREQDHCDCRKPKAGLLNEIMNKFKVTSANCLFVGDSFRDYEAALALEMPFALVLTGKGLKTLTAHPELNEKISIYDNLLSFANDLIVNTNLM